jgi:pentatricopeptide repeat protein
MAKKIGQVEYINSNYEALIHCYASLGEYDEFEKYFRLFSIRKDSLINKLHELEMNEMETKYKVEESIRESVQLQKANEEKEKEINKYKFLLIGVGGAIILLIFVYILFLRIRKK